ncbi:hypothetical protein [Rhodovulum strictum]|uniref:Uncharacterized protein n=1 Tax=Rhodovulum strictum TaxID=58314 RepID=A0A844B954_9RHOB|nr:hypothetical protein [Rhodovulum strictum]MRH22871.1 hypothetical protein [Rhodovulum strictum]
MARRLSPPTRGQALRALKAGGAALAEAPGAGKGKRDSRIRRDAATTTAGQVVICRLSPEVIGVFDVLCTQMG